MTYQQALDVGMRPFLYIPSVEYDTPGFEPPTMRLIFDVSDATGCPAFKANMSGHAASMGVAIMDPTATNYPMQRERLLFLNGMKKYSIQLSDTYLDDKAEGIQGTFYNPLAFLEQDNLKNVASEIDEATTIEIEISLRQDTNREKVTVTPITWQQILGFVGGVYGIAGLVVLVFFKYKGYNAKDHKYVYAPIGFAYKKLCTQDVADEAENQLGL